MITEHIAIQYCNTFPHSILDVCSDDRMLYIAFDADRRDDVLAAIRDDPRLTLPIVWNGQLYPIHIEIAVVTVLQSVLDGTVCSTHELRGW